MNVGWRVFGGCGGQDCGWYRVWLSGNLLKLPSQKFPRDIDFQCQKGICVGDITVASCDDFWCYKTFCLNWHNSFTQVEQTCVSSVYMERHFNWIVSETNGQGHNLCQKYDSASPTDCMHVYFILPTMAIDHIAQHISKNRLDHCSCTTQPIRLIPYEENATNVSSCWGKRLGRFFLPLLGRCMLHPARKGVRRWWMGLFD